MHVIQCHRRANEQHPLYEARVKSAAAACEAMVEMQGEVTCLEEALEGLPESIFQAILA